MTSPWSRALAALTAGVIVTACAAEGDLDRARGSEVPTSTDVATSTETTTSADINSPAAEPAFDLRVAGIGAPNGEGVFVQMLQLPSGTIIATGVDTSAGDTGAAQIYRSTDGGATFAAVPRPDPAEWANVRALLHHDGTTYAFGEGEFVFGLGFLWRSTDDGQTWSADFVAGVPTAAAIVDGVPLTATIGAEGDDIAPRIARGLAADAENVSTPAAIGLIHAIAELPDGNLVAFGERSDTDDVPTDPLDPLVWISRDRGVTWDDVATPSGAPNAQLLTTAARFDDGVLVGAIESTPSGDGHIASLRFTTDGRSFDELVSIRLGPADAGRPSIAAIATANRMVVALITGPGEFEDTLLVVSSDTGSNDAVPTSATGLRLATTLATLDGSIGVVGITDDAQPAIAVLTAIA